MRALRAFAGLSLALCGAGLAPAAAQDYPFDIGKRNAAAIRAWKAVVPTQYRSVSWIFDLAGTASALQSVTMRGKVFYYGLACKPHDCGGNTIALLIARDGGEAHGLLSSETLGVRARWFGAPDAEARKLLQDASRN